MLNLRVQTKNSGVTLKDYCAENPSKPLLVSDVGCGTRSGSHSFKDGQVVCCEVDPLVCVGHSYACGLNTLLAFSGSGWGPAGRKGKPTPGVCVYSSWDKSLALPRWKSPCSQ